MIMDETQQLILGQLKDLSGGQTQILAKVHTITTDVALLKQAQQATNVRLSNDYKAYAHKSDIENVRKSIQPLEWLVYGAVGVALVAICGAIIAGVVRSH